MAESHAPRKRKKSKKVISQREIERARLVIRDVLFELKRPLDPDYVGRRTRDAIYEQLFRLSALADRLEP
jgi:hypothetical protein